MHLLDILSFEIEEMNKCHSGSDFISSLPLLCDYNNHPLYHDTGDGIRDT